MMKPEPAVHSAQKAPKEGIALNFPIKKNHQGNGTPLICIVLAEPAFI